MTDLYRLVYTSRNLLQGSKKEIGDAVAGILATSQRNNTRVGVTGALLFNAGAFAQVLEGPQRAVEATFERIQRDPRHGDVTVLQCGAVDAPGFPSWSMAFIGQSEAGHALWNDMAAASGFDVSRLEGDAVFSMLHSLVLEEEGIPAAAREPSSHPADSNAAVGSFYADRVQAELPRPGQALAAQSGRAEVSSPSTLADLSLDQPLQPMPTMTTGEKTVISLAIIRAALADERARTTELRNELDAARVLIAESEERLATALGERDLWVGRTRLLATALSTDGATGVLEQAEGARSAAVTAAPTHTHSPIRSVA